MSKIETSSYTRNQRRTKTMEEIRPDWRTCKREEAILIEHHYRELQRHVRQQTNDIIFMLEMLAEMNLF